jgi:hypothetical protein
MAVKSLREKALVLMTVGIYIRYFFLLLSIVTLIIFAYR